MSARWMSIVLAVASLACGTPERVASPRADTVVLIESEPAPAPIVPAVSAPPRDHSAATCAAAEQLLRDLAAGQPPSGVAFGADYEPLGESPQQTAIGLAQTEGSEPSIECRCEATQCMAGIVWDVHRSIGLTFVVDADKPRLTRVHSTVGGW